MDGSVYYKYLKCGGNELFTVVMLPQAEGRFPSVVCRSPYVKNTQDKTEDEVAREYLSVYAPWQRRGYAVVLQHCRGQGKSSGAFVPYIYEREDGLCLREWIRKQPFYNGELYLMGASYTASVHYATAPFEDDIKGAVFEVQDCERYRLWYRNGQMRKGHANWHFGLYKSKCGLKKTFNMRSFSQLPLKGLSERVLGERAEDFEEMLAADKPTDAFWSTRFGGADARNAAVNANIPILFTTGYNDFYVGGTFKTWNGLDKATREKSALLVSPYNHGDGYDMERGLRFENGRRAERFGGEYRIDWFDGIRFGRPLPFKKGVITYYRTFENVWQSDFCAVPVRELALPLGGGTRSFRYDPLEPPAFCGEGVLADEVNTEGSVISVYTSPLARDVFVKGQMRARLRVSCDRSDSSFFVRVSHHGERGDYVLRHDITSLSYQLGAYTENSEVTLEFVFDEHAFLLGREECLRIDIAATDDNTYVCHTNRIGEYYLQDGADTAVSTVYLDGCEIVLPIEYQAR